MLADISIGYFLYTFQFVLHGHEKTDWNLILMTSLLYTDTQSIINNINYSRCINNFIYKFDHFKDTFQWNYGIFMKMSLIPMIVYTTEIAMKSTTTNPISIHTRDVRHILPITNTLIFYRFWNCGKINLWSKLWGCDNLKYSFRSH